MGAAVQQVRRAADDVSAQRRLHREWPDQARHGDREGHLPTLLEARNYRGHDSTEAPRGEAAQAQAYQAEVGGIAVRLDF